MEYVIFLVSFAAFWVFIYVQGKIMEKRQLFYDRKILKGLKGQMPRKEYKIERFMRIPGYFEKHKADFYIDDITWNDLNMDEVFVRMNYSMSSTGEEYLYCMLRTPRFDKQALEHLHKLASFYEKHDEQRINYQRLMKKLGNTDKYSLYDYLEYLYKLEKRSNTKDILALVAFACIMVVMYFSLGIGVAGLLVWIFYQVYSYFMIKRENEPYLTSLGYLMRLIDVSQEALQILPSVCAEEKKEIEKYTSVLKKSKKGASWVFGSLYKTGSPQDTIMDYVRMFFHFDLIYFNRMVKELTNHNQELDSLIGLLGYIESSISVALYRASLINGWCEPELGTEELSVKEGYHPLIVEPVVNSITTSKSVLITGSNASGKSTFLRMMAVNALMAQTVYTVTAKEYRSPYYYLYTSMSLRDDIENGDSYYMVEIKSIKRILDSKQKHDGKILCMIDEVLRGTNTVERIAASTQILFSMSDEKIKCFAATHDIELTQLLEERYENYHFEEEIKDKDVVFNYRLYPGKATSRNAIKLLEVMGYDEEIIENAMNLANRFLTDGIWKHP